jgi:hypothetical protein
MPKAGGGADAVAEDEDDDDDDADDEEDDDDRPAGQQCLPVEWRCQWAACTRTHIGSVEARKTASVERKENEDGPSAGMILLTNVYTVLAPHFCRA